MVLVALMDKPNKTLKGHKLLLLSPSDTPPEFIERLHTKFPDLEIVDHKTSWASTEAHNGGISDEEWRGVTILITGSTLPSIDKAPKLQYVQLLSAGANHLTDKPLFRDTEIAFCTANGVHGPQISEWVITTFLAFQHHRNGILGYGSIGRQLARVSKAMGMDVHAYTLHPRDTPESRRDDSYTPPGLGDPNGDFPSKWFSGGSTEDLHAFLSSDLDLVVVSLPLTPKTKGLIGKAEFKVMSERKTFVTNIARGPIVDTDDLIEALDEGVIRGAALDVTDPEPLPDGHRLWSAKNVLVTPHISGQSTSYNERVLDILELNLTRLSEGRELINEFNRKEGY